MNPKTSIMCKEKRNKKKKGGISNKSAGVHLFLSIFEKAVVSFKLPISSWMSGTEQRSGVVFSLS